MYNFLQSNTASSRYTDTAQMGVYSSNMLQFLLISADENQSLIITQTGTPLAQFDRCQGNYIKRQTTNQHPMHLCISLLWFTIIIFMAHSVQNQRVKSKVKNSLKRLEVWCFVGINKCFADHDLVQAVRLNIDMLS